MQSVVFASVVSEISQSELYMTVKARLFETPKANLNGVAVTAAFLDEIVEHEEKYVGLPLCADVKNLMSGKYDRLGHLYDARTGEFHSTQIGSFYHFEKEEFEGGAYCVGYARVMKRYKKVCKAIAELFAEGMLKFSFEVLCGSYTVQADGTQLIDASENNLLEGAAIVSFPACEDAVALDLVAEVESIADDTKRGETEMMDNEEIVAEENTPEEVTAEETHEENQEVQTAEEETHETAEETQEENHETAEETHETAEEAQETAEVYQSTTVEVRTHTSTYDSETGEDTYVEDVHRETVSGPAAGEGGAIAAEATEVAEEASEESHETAEEAPEQNLAQMIAELTTMVRDLQNEVASLRENHAVAEAIPDHSGDVNPFMGEVSAQDDWRSLLEKETPSDYHDLL